MRLIILALTLIAIPLAAQAQQYTLGVHYEQISAAPANTDRIEVLEVFNYGCPHCTSMQPYLIAWQKSRPEIVELKHMPATFRPDFELYARGYFAADSLGVLQQTHAAMFEQASAHRAMVRTIDEVADMYAALGVDRDKLIAASKSFAVDMRVREVNKKLPQMKVGRTPGFVVAGKYRVRNETMRDPADVFKVVDFLVAKEAAERGI